MEGAKAWHHHCHTHFARKNQGEKKLKMTTFDFSENKIVINGVHFMANYELRAPDYQKYLAFFIVAMVCRLSEIQKVMSSPVYNSVYIFLYSSLETKSITPVLHLKVISKLSF